MPESQDHKHIKEIIRDFFSSSYGAAIDEYSDSGFEMDVFSVTISSITIMVETIWTATKQNFYRDLTIVLSSDAQIKIVIVNPMILKKEELIRYFEKIKISETKKGYSIIGMLGWNFSDESSFLKELKVVIDKIIALKGNKITKKTPDLETEPSVSIKSFVLNEREQIGFELRSDQKLTKVEVYALVEGIDYWRIGLPYFDMGMVCHHFAVLYKETPLKFLLAGKPPGKTKVTYDELQNITNMIKDGHSHKITLTVRCDEFQKEKVKHYHLRFNSWEEIEFFEVRA